MKMRYLRLLAAYSDDEEMLEEIAEYIDRFPAYIHKVYTMELRKEIYRMTLEGADYREAFERIDHERHNAHELAISAITILNRLAEQANVPPLFEGDLGKRQEVAEFCMAFVREVFAARSIGRP